MELGELEYVKKRSLEIFTKNIYDDGNILYHQPGPGEYGSFFAWDSGWSVIGNSTIFPGNALKELQTIFKLQFDSGQISHEILYSHKNNGLSRKLLQPLLAGQFDQVGRSMFIDPPSFLISAEILYNRTKDKRVLDLLPSMEACFNYLVDKRDLFGDGLVSIVHPWESGCDWAPYFDEPMKIDINKRFWGLKYLTKYLKLIRDLAKTGWNLDMVKNDKKFSMEDVGVNGITAAGGMSISNLYNATGNQEKAEEYRIKAEKLINSIDKHLWVESKGFFYPREDLSNPHNVLRSTAIGLSPLLSGLIDSDKAHSVLDNYLLSKKHFNSPYPVAFNSRSELEENVRFNTPYLWRGPCNWMNINWIAAKAADIYGRRDIARDLTKKSVKLLERSDFREYYNPETGIGGGARNFTWGTLLMDMIEEYI
jgi:hypothetical protein